MVGGLLKENSKLAISSSKQSFGLKKAHFKALSEILNQASEAVSLYFKFFLFSYQKYFSTIYIQRCFGGGFNGIFPRVKDSD